MLFLVLSILCSVTVGIIFKIIRNYNICPSQVIAYNYFFAIILCYIFFDPNLSQINQSAPWNIYIPLMILLPSVFVLLARSIKQVGIARTDVAQRFSLFIPILAAWLIFKEDFNTYKIIGLVIGIPAILLIIFKKEEGSAKGWHYPALVLLGYGTVDILFKQVALQTTLPYSTSLFIVLTGAFILSSIAVTYQMTRRGIKTNLYNLAFGILVAIFNLGNIFFYLKAHKEFTNNPSTVFAGMNIGVIVLGCLAGVAIFKEKLSKLNYLGLFLAIIAIVFITLSQMKS
ncbi:EamA family transporter [Flavobacterium sp. Sd200]|uniref:EamA family transporter n=1 Tax=Flavobacterium sp. Sd200 TaxID=2692211 RepID=UPI00137063EA|nr:EamA family transporter [Flavobacterium sp. Sd200]MXN90235.1 EamA family transporter [Flavobacterium sp. Sd200]